MARAGEGKRGGPEPRTYVLIAVLVVVALWAQPWAQRKRPTQGARGPAPATAAAVAVRPSSIAPLSPGSPVGPGWGRDPFDPGRGASGTERTGR